MKNYFLILALAFISSLYSMEKETYNAEQIECTKIFPAEIWQKIIFHNLSRNQSYKKSITTLFYLSRLNQFLHNILTQDKVFTEDIVYLLALKYNQTPIQVLRDLSLSGYKALNTEYEKFIEHFVNEKKIDDPEKKSQLTQYLKNWFDQKLNLASKDSCENITYTDCWKITNVTPKETPQLEQVFEKLSKNLNNQNLLNLIFKELIFKGNVHAIQILLSLGINPKDSLLLPDLILSAVKNNNFKMVELLINSGFKVNVYDQNNNTPLIFSIINNNLKIATYLIKKGCNLNVVNGKSPLHYAYLLDNFAILNLLFENGADINCKDDIGNSLLYYAAYMGDIEFVKLLLCKNVKLDVQGGQDKTALICAVQHNHLDIVKLLVDAQADPNIRDSEGKTAFDIAYLNKHI